MTTYEKIKELCENAGFSISSIGQKIPGISINKASITGWKNGSKPRPDKIKAIAEFFGVSPEYLTNDASDRARGVRIPVIGNSAAGLPISAIQEYIDDNNPDTWEEISKSMAASGDYVAIRIKGDSMEPRIMDGDIVIVRIQPDVENDDTAIVMVNGDEATCKKIKKRTDGIMLVSNNPKYDPLFYPNESIQALPIKIYGKVVEVRGKL